MVQRALKSTYSKITEAGLYFSDRASGECSASTYLLMMGYEPGVKGKTGWTFEWGGVVSVTDTEKKLFLSRRC